MKLKLLTNATVVDDAIRFVSSNQSKEKTISSSNDGKEDEVEESNEPDYGEDKDQLEDQHEETAETTINQVF
jgi:hypothetical protein